MVVGLDEELDALLAGLGYNSSLSEENRTDFYLHLGSDFIGAKVRAGKKWECKYKVYEDPCAIETYVKRKYGKAANFATYVAEVRLAMQELVGVSPAERFDELLHGATIPLKKSRRMLPGPSPSSIGVEVCMIEVAGTSWVSIAVEGDSFDDVYAELQLEKYSSLFTLLHRAANLPRGSWVLGGYPKFVRAINEGLTDHDYASMASSIDAVIRR